MPGVLLYGTTSTGDRIPLLVNSDGSLAGGGGGGGGGSTDVSTLNKEATQASILAKLIAAPSTEAKQDATITALGSGGILATGSKQDTLHTDLQSLISNSAQSTSAATSLGALNASVTLNPGRKGTQIIQVTGTFVGTISLLGNLDGTNYITFGATPQFLNLNTGAYTATITAAGIYQTSVNGLVNSQLKMTAYTSGAAVVTTSLTDAPAMVALDASLPAGTSNIGKVVIADSTGAVPVVKGASAAAAGSDLALAVTQSPNYVAAAGVVNANFVANSVGAAIGRATTATIMELDCFNPTAAAAYIKLYNKATAPTVGTDVPVLVIDVQPGIARVLEFGQYGKRFTSGISYAVTTGMADTDATAPTTAGIKLGITYV